jgi:hypothetical protein
MFGAAVEAVVARVVAGAVVATVVATVGGTVVGASVVLVGAAVVVVASVVVVGTVVSARGSVRVVTLSPTTERGASWSSSEPPVAAPMRSSSTKIPAVHCAQRGQPLIDDQVVLQGLDVGDRTAVWAVSIVTVGARAGSAAAGGGGTGAAGVAGTGSRARTFSAVTTCSVHCSPSQYRPANRLHGSRFHPGARTASSCWSAIGPPPLAAVDEPRREAGGTSCQPTASPASGDAAP